MFAIYAPLALKRPMAMETAHKHDSLPPSHEELLTRVGSSADRKAFVTLFNYFGPRIKSYLMKHGADSSTAEEIVQNTFVTVWEKAGSYDPKKAAASTWIFTVARNKRIDALRREKFIDYNSDALPLEQAAAPDTDYTDGATGENLAAAIKQLPPEQAQLIRMAFLEDKSHQKIAEQTHLPLGTVKSRIRLALKRLKKILNVDEETS